jgi:hypothetical protein
MISITFEIPSNWGERIPELDGAVFNREWLENRDRLRTYTDMQEALNPAYLFHDTWKKPYDYVFGRVTLIHNEQKAYMHVINFEVFIGAVTAPPLTLRNSYMDFYVSNDFWIACYPPSKEGYLRLDLLYVDSEDEPQFLGEYLGPEDLPLGMWGDKYIRLHSFNLPVIEFYTALIPEAQKVLHLERVLKQNDRVLSHLEERIEKIKAQYGIK